MTRFVSITSGKGGVGKTSIAVNLSMQLAQRGKRVCLIDADWGLANVNVMLRLRPQHTLEDVIVSGLSLDTVMLRNVQGVDILPGSSGSERMAQLSPEQQARLASAMQELGGYDFVIIDSSSGIARNVLALSLASPEVLMVITPEPTSMTDAYALLKLLYAEAYQGQVRVIVNHSRNHSVGRHTYDKFREVVEFYLKLRLPLLGLVQEDERMHKAVLRQQALSSHHPESAAARDIGSLAGQLLLEDSCVNRVDTTTFWNLYLEATGAVAQQSGRDEVEVSDDESPERAELEDQIEVLNTRIDALIKELTQLRKAGDNAPGSSVVPLDRGRRRLRSCCPERWVAELASDFEIVGEPGNSFPVYELEQADGKVIRFACHSLDDAYDNPEPQSTSS